MATWKRGNVRRVDVTTGKPWDTPGLLWGDFGIIKEGDNWYNLINIHVGGSYGYPFDRLRYAKAGAERLAEKMPEVAALKSNGDAGTLAQVYQRKTGHSLRSAVTHLFWEASQAADKAAAADG